MKRIYGALAVLAVIIVITTLHICNTMSVSNKISEISEAVYKDYYNEDWDKVQAGVEEMADIWHRNRLWACSTLSTKQVDEIDISIEQSLIYSKVKAKDNFIGEFRMFCMLIEHLPKQEGPSIYELL